MSCCFSASKVIGQIENDTAYTVTDSLIDSHEYSTEKLEYNDDPIESGEEIKTIQRNISLDSIHSIQNDKDFYYMSYIDSLLRANEAAKKKQPEVSPKPSISFWNLPFIKYGLWVLAIIIICSILYKLFLEGGMFRSNKKQTSVEIKIEEDIAESDVERQMQRAILNKNYRLATRYQFLKTLNKLGEKGILQLATDKTNYQYASDLRVKSASSANHFSRLSLQYEYIWFGEFNINEEQFSSIQQQHKQFLNSL